MKRLGIAKSLVLAFGLLSAGLTFAGSGFKYDWQSGNSYSWRSDASGNTHVNGFNTQTGSQWNTTIRRNGNMNGWDSKGNAWQYNNNSGMYYNYGTGEMRYRGQRW